MVWLAFAVPVVVILLYIVFPQVGVWLYRRLAALHCSHTDAVCLTFDDGPDQGATPSILSVLRHHGVRATFFVLGRSAELNPEVVLSIVREGHTLGIHGYRHVHPWRSNPISYLRDLIRGAQAVARAAGVKKIVLFRPPFGKANLLTILYTLFTNRSLVFWTIDPRDYAESSAYEIVRSVLNDYEQAGSRGGTVLLHDGRIGRWKDHRNCTPEAVDHLCRALRQRGYCLEPLMKKQRGSSSIRMNHKG